jgi:hypothetical protein
MVPSDKDLRAAALYALIFYREWERGRGIDQCDAVALETVETLYLGMSA